MQNIDNKPQVYSPISWTALQYFNIYRILLAGLFVVFIHIGQLPQPLGTPNTYLFSVVISYTYLAVAIIFLCLIRYQYPSYNLQVSIHVLADITILSLMIYISNGLDSGFGILLVIAVAGGSILRTGKISIFFAAVATLSVIGHEIYVKFFLFYQDVNYVHAGFLGAAFFITAVIGNLLSGRVKETEALAQQQALEIAELGKLNEQIVQRMQSGILVLDNNMTPLLINQSARKMLLGAGYDGNLALIQEAVSRLQPHVDEWLQHEGKDKVIFQPNRGESSEVQASFIRLNFRSGYQILVFLEDMENLRQRAQQMKLASLGRLAASIAHEIRNPLGAISHAGQLLYESRELGDEGKRLTEIINEHSARVNNIIENVLNIGRRGQIFPERIPIKHWILKFVEEVKLRFGLDDDMLELIIKDEDIKIHIDPSQLHQILWNLCENALRYSTGKPILKIYCGIDVYSKNSFIDITDYGYGISMDATENLFEPFFTTESKGTGLGLYLAREMCEANHANLSLLNSSEQGSTFRILFMHIDETNSAAVND